MRLGALPAFVLALTAAVHARADDPAIAVMEEGNWADALQIYRGRLDSGEGRPGDLARARQCLGNLGRWVDFDALVEGVVARYAEDPAMLSAAAEAYGQVPSYGHIVAGEFRRGRSRGGAETVWVDEQDRIRRIRLAWRAYRAVAGDQDLGAAALGQISEALLHGRSGRRAWRLQRLTDLEADLELPTTRYRAPGGDPPVDSQGLGPRLYAAPRQWSDAVNDGERWRWCGVELKRLDPGRAAVVDLAYAEFLHRQFGVQTLRQSGWFLPGGPDDPLPETSSLAVQTLADDETIARLATGVKRFSLPEGHRFIELYREHASWQTLFEIYLNRNQRSRAIEVGERWLDATSGALERKRVRDRLLQVSRPWARFETAVTQPAGVGATLRVTHRNAAQIEMVAKPVDVRQLLADVREAITAPDRNDSRRRFDVENLGWRLVQENPQEYVGESIASWTSTVETLADHRDAREAIATPLQKAGAYLINATPVDADGRRGAETNVVVWIADTVLVRKPTARGVLYQALDAATGRPTPGALIDLFGYRAARRGGGEPRFETKRVAIKTDDDGLARFDQPSQGDGRRFAWLAVATTTHGRLAHQGFSSLWRGSRNQGPPDEPRTFLVTDRPIYRPGDTVEFKAWIGKPDYLAASRDAEAAPSEYAHQEFQVEVFDARREKVDSQRVTADVYGGLVGSYTTAEDAALGAYRLRIAGFGGGGFRVEEYRKPEFEVFVDAPGEPTKLGDPFEAVVRASYYAGSPVRGGSVKYKVTRTRRSDRWLPIRPWDWLYGRGYGWLGQDAAWRSDWRAWGCFAPSPPWLPVGGGPPEVVAEGEAELDDQGLFRLSIDTTAALERQPNNDHQYKVAAEVTDAGRRTVVGSGTVLAARRPVEVTTWLGHGFYEVGDTVRAYVSVRRPDGAPVAAGGELRLLKISPPDPEQAAELLDPEETLVQSWTLPTDSNGLADMRLKASEAGRYRIVYRTEASDAQVAGGALFSIRGPGFQSADFRFGDLELVPDKPEYAAGDTVRLLVNTDRRDATVTLFVRPVGGVYLQPEVLQLDGKSTVVELPVGPADMPNFFVEAHTVSGGKLHTVARRIVVPPESRVLQVQASPSAPTYLPGEEGSLRVRVTDEAGEPIVGQVTIAVYDRSVEAIAGGPSGGDIRERFWDWTRRHQPVTWHNLLRSETSVVPKGTPVMQPLGVFGEVIQNRAKSVWRRGFAGGMGGGGGFGAEVAVMGAPMAAPSETAVDALAEAAPPPGVAVRENFADTALWVGAVETDADGQAEVALPLPESLTSWKVRAWAVSQGLRVGQGEAEVVTRKELMVRLRAPRFLVERDEAVVSALVQNESSRELTVNVTLQADGDPLDLPSAPRQSVTVPANGEALVDWRVSARRDGEATLRVIADVPGEEQLSDGMQVDLPVLVHGAEIVESFSAVIGPDDRLATFEIVVPEDRRPDATRLEVRYAPSLVGSMLDALPYLIEFPHGCTEQTLNRFLPAVIVRQTIEDLGVELAELRPVEPLAGPSRSRDAVFDREELDRITRAGVTKLMDMQLSDGGWGWFSGWGEFSSAHTTMVVVRGLRVARDAGVAVPDDVIRRGVDWLARYREEQLARLRNVNEEGDPIDSDKPWKRRPDNLDAMVELTLAGANAKPTDEMLQRLFEHRLKLSPYCQAALGLVLVQREAIGVLGGLEYSALLDRVIKNLKQYVQTDDENQTAWLDLPGGSWWYWYGSEYEAHAYFLKLLAATEPEGDLAPRIVKYLLANRRHAARWNSTRDTALVVEAMAEYVRASGEGASEGNVEVWLDGKLRDTQRFDATAALRFDGRYVLEGAALPAGRHTLELRKSGRGRLYASAALANFSLEDDLRAAGLEVRVSRRIQKLVPIEATDEDVDSRGGLLAPKVERYRRVNVPNLGAVDSGDLVEVELTITSKNDYEYLVIEDPKPAGFEPVEDRSGYNGNAIGAYVEFRDQRVLLYARSLARGERSVTYRLRAETPGRYSALPTEIRAMYAPDLRGNSDEIKVLVEDSDH